MHTTFGPKVVHFPARNKLIQNLQISHGCIFLILQRFAAKLFNFSRSKFSLYSWNHPFVLLLTIEFLYRCYSRIGRSYARQGPQVISIGQHCDYEDIIIHEMLHSVGRISKCLTYFFLRNLFLCMLIV
jgi:hypothetical protein